ncbi:amidase signature enzyme [Exidia glandulosa HHB12029]|uniref:amidase n=1 Tax=Exidia glandulosa HHB12029 TaxID=1314781 RepID=A0A165NWQ5_EXIGL|nr:amidase signature enzyme [Exidia glandulosa HHB12029]
MFNPYSYYKHHSTWDILAAPISQIVSQAHAGVWTATRILSAFGKQALAAQEYCNCLTEVLLDKAHTRATKLDALSAPARTNLPLFGLPVSLKDSIDIRGYDSTNGYSDAAFHPASADAAVVRLLKDAGALVYVKTNIPTTLLSFDSRNDVYGVTGNPHNTRLVPGGSSGGEAALIAFGGSRIGIGTDIAGSVRVPAHFCGIYSVRSSFGRFPRGGIASSLPGQEGVLGIAAPMAKSLDDLEWFWERVVDMEPWKYDHSCNVLPWKPVDLSKKKLKFGVMWNDGLVHPTPACQRATFETADRLKKAGHEVVDFSVPDAPEALIIGWSLILADGGKTMTSRLHSGEFIEPGVTSLLKRARLPRLIKSIYCAYLRWKGETWYANLIQPVSTKTVDELWQLVVKRNGWRQKVQDAWDADGIDFVLCAPNPAPAPVGGPDAGPTMLLSCGHTFLWNILDYTAGILPVSTVNPVLDLMIPSQRAAAHNMIEKAVYDRYDASASGSGGMPVGVQIVGQRLQEERVLAAMRVVENAWKE